MKICCLLPILGVFFVNIVLGFIPEMLSDPIQIACTAINFSPFFVKFDENEVKFLMWTKDNEEDGKYYKLLPYSTESLQKSKLDVDVTTYAFFHGYDSFGEEKWILDSKTSILSLNKSNIISINFKELVKKGTSDLDYGAAVCNAYKVARYVAEVFNWINNKTGITGSRIHFIGHSLGVHVAGIAASYMKNLKVGQVSRITGLDPAGPLFSKLFLGKFRVDKSQTNFLDVIHTNGGEFPCFGLKEELGHVDFYPNGGVKQPGCGLDTSRSHVRAQNLWVESIVPLGKDFKSWPCRSWKKYEAGGCKDCSDGCPIMGFHVPTSARGAHYLSTNAVSPFAKGNEQK